MFKEIVCKRCKRLVKLSYKEWIYPIRAHIVTSEGIVCIMKECLWCGKDNNTNTYWCSEDCQSKMEKHGTDEMG